MRLYEIKNGLIEAFDRATDPETGEIIDEAAFAEYEALEMAQEEKRENLGLWIKDLKAEAAAIREEERTLAARRRSAENKADRLTALLEWDLDGEKFKTPRLAISYRTSEAVEIDPEKDPATFPEEYLKRPAPEVNKLALKAALKEGQEIPGARLVKKTNIQIK